MTATVPDHQPAPLRRIGLPPQIRVTLAPSGSSAGTRRGRGGEPVIDLTAAELDQVTRAVQAVVEAIAPGVVAEVTTWGPDPFTAAVPDDAPPPAPAAPTDDLVIQTHSRTVCVDGCSVPLTRREFELLAYLHARRGVALTRRELMTSIWHERYLPGDRTIDVHIRRLRIKLGRHAGRLHTLRGFGYRLD